MTLATRGVRAGPVLAALLLGAALVASWGLSIDPARVGALADADEQMRASATRAWIALRPLPTIVAADVRVGIDERVLAEFPHVTLRLAVMPLLERTIEWRAARLRRGGLVIRKVAGNGTVRCVDVRGRIWAVGDRRAHLDLQGDCHGLGLVVEHASYRGDATWGGDGARASGRLGGGLVRLWGGVEGDSVAASVRAGADGVRLDGIRIGLGGGAIAGRLRWLDRDGRRRLAVEFEGMGDDAEAATAGATLPVTGRWVVRGRARSVVPAGVALDREAMGTGRLVLLDGRVTRLNVGGALLDGLEVWRGRRRRRLRQRFPDVFDEGGLRFERATVHARLRRARWYLAPVRVRSTSYHAQGGGRIGRDGSVRAAIGLVPSEALADALLGRGALRAILRGDRDELTLPIEIRGHIGGLRARPAPDFARDVLERALGGGTLDRLLGR